MANVTLGDLTSASGVTADDLILIENDPAGTPASQKATAAQLLTYIEANITAGSGDMLSTNNLSDVVSAATARTNLGVDAAGTDNSTNVTLAGSLDYLTLSGQQITLGAIDLATDTTGSLAISNLSTTGTASSSTFLRGDGQWTAIGGGGDMLAANNLSDLANASTARTNLGVAIGSDVQAYSAVLDGTTASFTTADETKLDGIETGADVTDTANVTAAGALMDSEVTNLAQVKAFDSTDYEAANADILKADEGDNLTAGYTSDAYAHGTVSSGTITPAPATGEENFQTLTNGGAFTLAPPASNCTVVIQITNNGSAGAITTSGFTKVDGSFTTTDGDDFLAQIIKLGSFSYLNIVALQ
ncbi:MAG: hypothetical protein AAFV69_14020 [Pseudomonadota bacterium]